MKWTTREIKYLEEHANDGAEEIAEALGRTIISVQVQACRYGISLAPRCRCPKCGAVTRKPQRAYGMEGELEMKATNYKMGYDGTARIIEHRDGTATLITLDAWGRKQTPCESVTSAKRELSRYCDGNYQQI